MKKLLVIHTEYQEKGGEDIAVRNEIDFLSKYFETDELIFSNVIDNYLLQTVNFFRNKNSKSLKIIDKKIEKFKPDIVYIHNTWFKVSLGILTLLVARCFFWTVTKFLSFFIFSSSFTAFKISSIL